MAKGDSKSKTSKPKASKASGVRRVEKSASANSAQQNQSLPLEIQQTCLNIFRDAVRSGREDTTSLQEVKGHLYERNFALAFGKEEYLRAYAARWSPSRALGYAEIFAGLKENPFDTKNTEISSPRTIKLGCLGGGAGAELVGLAGLLLASEEPRGLAVNMSLVDVAEWSGVVGDLHHRIVQPLELSKYASAAAVESNLPLLKPESFEAHFSKQDILTWSVENTSQFVGDCHLVTLMFTLNELYSSSMPKTQKFLSHLAASMSSGALLLVVDSPGSYSTVTINGTEKKYPMQWLLDLTLLGPPDGPAVAKWDKLDADDSRWFRLPEGLNYPIPLEDMRYQIQLYRKKENKTSG